MRGVHRSHFHRVPGDAAGRQPARQAPPRVDCSTPPASEPDRHSPWKSSIIGGGIGGLTLALSCIGPASPCRVYESVREIRPLGVGINILPHASRELATAGPRGRAIARLRARARGGVLQPLRPTDLPRAARSSTPGYERSAVLDPPRRTAASAARCRRRADRAPTACLPGWTCIGFEQDAAGVVAAFPRHAQPAERPRPARRCRSSPAMACIRSCASSFIPTKARRSIRASTCGAAFRPGHRSSPARA